ncbi:MAG: hypothetical protein WAN11_28335 [Syntrophobacteraceae bacterium]
MYNDVVLFFSVLYASLSYEDGVLRVISQQTRSQAENKVIAVGRFAELLRDALKQVPVRKKTRMSKGAKLRRLEGKAARHIQR